MTMNAYRNVTGIPVFEKPRSISDDTIKTDLWQKGCEEGELNWLKILFRGGL
jgi:hypothetical protein